MSLWICPLHMKWRQVLTQKMRSRLLVDRLLTHLLRLNVILQQRQLSVRGTRWSWARYINPSSVGLGLSYASFSIRVGSNPCINIGPRRHIWRTPGSSWKCWRFQKSWETKKMFSNFSRLCSHVPLSTLSPKYTEMSVWNSYPSSVKTVPRNDWSSSESL